MNINTLLLISHPDFSKSKINKALAEIASQNLAKSVSVLNARQTETK